MSEKARLITEEEYIEFKNDYQEFKKWKENQKYAPKEPSLEPCPFCGSDSNYEVNLDGSGFKVYSAYCPNCGASIPNQDSVEEMENIWNQRFH